VLNYVLSKLLVFRKKSAAAGEPDGEDNTISGTTGEE